MGEQPLLNVVHQGEIEARVGQCTGEGLFPIETAADGVSRLAVGKPLAVPHHHDQGQAPRRHCNRPLMGRIEIGK